MAAITIADVRNNFAGYLNLLNHLHGKDMSNYRLAEGSKTYGNPFRIEEVINEAGGIRVVANLGYTKREADTALDVMRAALWETAPAK